MSQNLSSAADVIGALRVKFYLIFIVKGFLYANICNWHSDLDSIAYSMRVILVLTAMLGLSLAFEDKTVFQYLVDTPGYGTLESLLRATGLDNVLTSVGKSNSCVSPFLCLSLTWKCIHRIGGNRKR